MKNSLFLAAIAALAIPQLMAAQDHDLEAQLRQYLAPPELVMRFQRQLNITDEQRQSIRERISEMQTEIMDLQWDLQDQGQALVEIVSQDSGDLSAALMQLDRMLDVESSITRNHMRMLLEIRNILNLEQRQQLRELMEEIASREIRERERRRVENEPASRQLDHNSEPLEGVTLS